MRLPQIILALLCLILFKPLVAQDLLHYMEAQPAIKEIKEMEGNSFFEHSYVIKVRQPINYKDTSDGFFLQRVFVSEKKSSQPTVFITEGYAANYAASPKYVNELSTLLDANQICVEHRYFGESYPDSLVWDYLTVENAANDHHRVVGLFRPYFSGKWLNTGISKGGQTAIAHRCFFPNDVDLTVAYVAPLNFGVEDGRHEPFLDQVGAAATRQAIRDLQLEVLKRRDKLTPMLQAYCEKKNYHAKMSYDEMLDYVVLEYPFAFWQWGYSADVIPSLDASDREIFEHLHKISEPDYFTNEGSKPYHSFFYQAERELGYYGYDIKPFKKYMVIHSAVDYMKRYMLPTDCQVVYEPRTAFRVDKFMREKASNVVLIYGETDPWSATAAELREDPSNRKVVAPGGSHKTRIATLPEEMKQETTAFIRSKMMN